MCPISTLQLLLEARQKLIEYDNSQRHCLYRLFSWINSILKTHD